MILTSLFNWVRVAKVVAIAFVCGVVIVANSAPALAFGLPGSAEPSQGTVEMDELYQESKQVAEGQPRGMEEVSKKASEGLNGVQGAANASKMKSSGDSANAETVKEDIADALESALDD